MPDCLSILSADPSWSAQVHLAESLAPSLSCTPRKVRTVGVFYYRLHHGGVEHVLSLLSSLWTEAGFRVVLFTDEAPSSDDYPFPADSPRYVLPDTFTLTPETRAARFRALQAACEAEKIDVFIHNAFLSRNLFWDLLAVKALGVPFVEYIHGSFTCQLSGGVPADMDQLFGLSRILACADRLVCLSESFCRFWGAFNPGAVCFPNPCDPPRPADPPLSRDPDLLLWVGRIAPEKQPEFAVRILAAVRRERPGARLLMLGGTDEAYRPYLDSLKAVIARLSLEDAVTLAGHQDPAEAYQRSSLLLVTSSGEGYGLAIAEAKTYGLPCVSFDLPCNAFTAEKQGLFTVPMNDETAAAREIIRLLSDPAARAQAGKDAKNSAETFSAPALKDLWAAFFRSFDASFETRQPAVDKDVLSALLSDAHIGLEKLDEELRILREKASGGALSAVFDPDYYAAHNPDLRKLAGNDMALLRHFLTKGMKEGRRACESFDPSAYRDRYPDLKAAFGRDNPSYYYHFLLHGQKEGRSGN